MKTAKRNKILMDVAPGLRAILSSTAVLAGVIIATAPANAAPIGVANGDFETVPVPDWYWVPDWNEGGGSYVASDAASFGWSGAGRVLYLDSGGWVDQNLGYNWTTADVFTLGIKGNKGWNSSGAFKVQLRQADATVLWDSETIPVTSTIDNFSWNIDASTFSGAGVVPGSQLNLRIECLSGTAYLDDVTLSTSVTDATPPTLASADIVDDKSGGPVNQGQPVTYTVTFSEDMDASTVEAADFGNAGTAPITIDTVTETTPGVFTVQVTPTGAGSLQLQVNAAAVLKDVAGNDLDTTSPILDDTTLTVPSDNTAPTLAGSDIVDNKSGGPVVVDDLVTYTVTFSEDMDASTVDATDFGNAGSAPITIGTVGETAPNSGVFTVPVTPTGAGSLQLKVNAGAVLMDVPGNSFDTGSAIPDDTSISVNPVGTTTIAIVNAGFETDVGPGFSTEVSAWNEGADSYVTSDAAFYGWSGAGRVLYLDSGGWVDQNVNYNWTAGEVFTLGIKGHQGWRPGGAFKIQLRQADGTVLWDSGTTPVAATVGNFRWSIDASTFSGAGVVPGSQLNLRIECLSATAYLDDVTLSTSLTDTTAPTLASADIVDNKSGGPVNPGQLVTYSVTFSEAMNSGTVSSSDFDNGGTAAVLIGTPTTTDGIQYQIPAVASSAGTLQLRVPAGATMTDLADIPLDTGSAILDDTTIDVVAKPIGVTGGDFEIPAIGEFAQPGDIPLWFNSTIAYAAWHNSSGYTTSGSQSALLQNYGSHGYMYQSLGQLEAGTTSLDWSFDQVRYTLDASDGTADMRFFYGVSTGVGEGVDIDDTLGLTQIGSTVSIPALSGSDAFRSGSLDVSAVPAGSTIWVDFTHTGGGCFLLDNIVTLIDTPTTGYAAWQATNGATGTINEDHDNDGVPNGIEWFVGGNTNTTGFTPLPGVSNSGGSLSVTWVRHPDYPGFPGNYGTDFVVETSATLTGPWTEESSPGNVTITGNDVTYTFPSPLGSKNFARLKVTGP